MKQILLPVSPLNWMILPYGMATPVDGRMSGGQLFWKEEKTT